MINAKVLNDAGIDYNAGFERFMEDRNFYEAVLTAFAGSDVLQRAQKAYGENDRETLLKAVHEAKGSCGNAGFDDAFAEASALVNLLRSERCTEDEYAEGYARFEKAYSDTLAAVKAALE